MPYAIRKARNGQWVVIKKTTGKVVSHHATRSKAKGSVAARYAHEKPGR